VGSEVLETETLASRLPEGRTSLSGEASGREKVIRTVVLLGLGLSGMAALIYEVVWTRSLSTVMGSSTYALSTMLAAFMAGLSIGGLLGARLSPRLKNPAMAFGLCELGIGIFGLATIPVILALTPLYIASF
jgi:spermidine synthase